MRPIFISTLSLLSVLMVNSCSHSQNEYPVLKGPYMGQPLPGKTAEVFAPGVISTNDWELEAVFAPGMDEFYFVTDGEDFNFPTDREKYERPTIFGFRYAENRWSKFLEIPRTGEPFITADGQTMHLAKGYRTRTAAGWSDVESLGPMFEREDWGIMRLTASTGGTYVFDDFRSGIIRTSKIVDGERQNPFELPEQITSGEFTAHPYIAPDESYLIWDSEREGGYGESDLYISFRQTDGAWGPAINMGPDVNSDKDDFYASVTPDGKFLMFDRTVSKTDDHLDVDIYWADAQIIEDLRYEDENRTTTASPYLGQKPPGLTPEVFAPGIVSIDGRLEYTVSFSSDFTEMYFSADNEDEETSIYFSKLKDDEWAPIERVTFTNGEQDEEFHPFVSSDGKRIYFTAMDATLRDPKIWYVNRLGDSWSDAVFLDSPVNDDPVFFSNQAENGDLYYFNLKEGKTYYAPNRNGAFPQVQEVALESGHHAFISPSQDYLILTARSDAEDGRSDNDMYVYFKNEDGAWAKPINLGTTINTRFNEKTPTITPDGKYLFFGRDERDIEPGLANIYWVSTDVIEMLRPSMRTK